MNFVAGLIEIAQNFQYFKCHDMKAFCLSPSLTRTNLEEHLPDQFVYTLFIGRKKWTMIRV